MPDKRQHRGPHPADVELFAAPHHATLREAAVDLSWLLTRGYAPNAALKLVGDRLQLTERQRLAVMRSACSDRSLQRRRSTQTKPDQLPGCTLQIDGFNLLTTVEAALAGGVLILGRDGCLRDMASMHGSYRKVAETLPALECIGEAIVELQVGGCNWLFDRPVSNSGRIAGIVRDVGTDRGWNWDAEPVDDPDAALMQTEDVVVSADSVVIDGCRRWFDLAGFVVRRSVPAATPVDFRTDADQKL